jgi:hypothetical protein
MNVLGRIYHCTECRISIPAEFEEPGPVPLSEIDLLEQDILDAHYSQPKGRDGQFLHIEGLCSFCFERIVRPCVHDGSAMDCAGAITFTKQEIDCAALKLAEQPGFETILDAWTQSGDWKSFPILKKALGRFRGKIEPPCRTIKDCLARNPWRSVVCFEAEGCNVDVCFCNTETQEYAIRIVSLKTSPILFFRKQVMSREALLHLVEGHGVDEVFQQVQFYRKIGIF